MALVLEEGQEDNREALCEVLFGRARYLVQREESADNQDRLKRVLN